MCLCVRIGYYVDPGKQKKHWESESHRTRRDDVKEIYNKTYIQMQQIIRREKKNERAKVKTSTRIGFDFGRVYVCVCVLRRYFCIFCRSRSCMESIEFILHAPVEHCIWLVHFRLMGFIQIKWTTVRILKEKNPAAYNLVAETGFHIWIEQIYSWGLRFFFILIFIVFPSSRDNATLFVFNTLQSTRTKHSFFLGLVFFLFRFL